MKSIRRRSVACILSLILLCSGLLAACHAQSDRSEGTASMSVDSASGESGAMDTVNGAKPEELMEESTTGLGGNAGGVDSGTRPTDEEKLIENLYYKIETLQFEDSVEKVQNLYEELGGYVQESSVEGISGQHLRYAHYVLRIPQEKVSQFQGRTSELGNVLRVDTNVQNVTDTYYDIEARLKSLRTQEERLLALLEESGSLEDIIQLEQALSDVTYEIEKLTGTLRNYDSLIEYTTVTIDLQEVTKETEVSQAPVTLGERMSAQFHSTMTGLGALGEAALIFLVGSLPVLFLLAILCLVVFLIVRRITRSHKKKREPRPEEPFTKPNEDFHNHQE